jgi:selenide,water dikinase
MVGMMMNPPRLTANTRFSGCGAKLGPGLLDQALCGLEQPAYPDLLVGFGTSDDAGVYRIDEETAVVQTIDFFPPIVDDPFTFGRIAAANALSDIYAMGARPITALSVVCFPVGAMEIEVLRAMMKGGLEAMIEAGCALVGGHSIEDDSIKFGFAVTGLVHPDRALRNNTARPGEALILTKPLGTGLVNTALRAGMVSPAALEAAVASMTRLNREAGRIAAEAGASACTDVTGFGLLGHAAEMVTDAETGLRIDFASIPLLPDIAGYAATGLIPAGTYRNRDFRKKIVVDHDGLPAVTSDILFDPQTSGGLLFTVAREKAAAVIAELIATGAQAAIIGGTTGRAGAIEVIP